MLNFIKNNAHHFILILFLYSTLYCYEKIYIMFILFIRMGFISWSAPPSEQIGYLIFYSCLYTQHSTRPSLVSFGHTFIFYRKLDHTTLVGTLRRRDFDTCPSYGRISQNTKWSSAKYLVRNFLDEGTCVPWVQNGGIHGL